MGGSERAKRVDLYHIPNDDGSTYRLKKFVEYQHEVPSIHYRFIGEWAKKFGYSQERYLNMCWLMSVTYNEITCIILDYMMNALGMGEDIIWEKYKERLEFGSARKYAKNCDWFVPLMKEWREITEKSPENWLKIQQKETGEGTYLNLQKTLGRMKYVGRFSADLFIESITYRKDFLGLRIEEPSYIDWENGANLTSGIYNIFYEDEKASLYEKTRRLSDKEKEILAQYLRIIQQAIISQYPLQDAEITMFVGKICSFRNLFKKTRYGGFHHDRELGVIKNYEKSFPEYDFLLKECYRLRFEIFPHKFLGEIFGWDGIRKDRKKLWIQKGLTGVEEGS